MIALVGYSDSKLGVRWSNTPHLNKIVSGIRKLPRIACRKGAVLLGMEAKTTNTPFRASKSPMRRNCHWGNFRSSFVMYPLPVITLTTAATRVARPNITTKEKDAKLRTKYGSMLPVACVPLLFSPVDALQFSTAEPVHRGRLTFCPVWPNTARAANRKLNKCRSIALSRQHRNFFSRTSAMAFRVYQSLDSDYFKFIASSELVSKVGLVPDM